VSQVPRLPVKALTSSDPLTRFEALSRLVYPRGNPPACPILSVTLLLMDTIRNAYDQVYAYTMGRPGFILQHVVDAFAVQSANEDGKRIGVVFGLVGLYLHVEKQFSGLQVQKVHMQLGRSKRQWPSVHFPEDRGRITVMDVLAATAGPERDRAIDDWCKSVWTSFNANRPTIITALGDYKINKIAPTPR
jgi:Family of unknown function (DUF5946)